MVCDDERCKYSPHLLVEMDSGVGSEALLAGDASLAGGLECGGLADLVEHVVVVNGGIDTKIALVVGIEQANGGIFLAEPGEECRAEIPGIGIGKMHELGFGLSDEASAFWS